MPRRVPHSRSRPWRSCRRRIQGWFRGALGWVRGIQGLVQGVQGLVQKGLGTGAEGSRGWFRRAWGLVQGVCSSSACVTTLQLLRALHCVTREPSSIVRENRTLCYSRLNGCRKERRQTLQVQEHVQAPPTGLCVATFPRVLSVGAGRATGPARPRLPPEPPRRIHPCVTWADPPLDNLTGSAPESPRQTHPVRSTPQPPRQIQACVTSADSPPEPPRRIRPRAPCSLQTATPIS